MTTCQSCDKEIGGHRNFRGDAERQEFYRTGECQDCQDRVGYAKLVRTVLRYTQEPEVTP